MRADGSSVVTLLISRSTELIQRRSLAKEKSLPRVAVFQLKQVQIGVHNNTNPLITEHFQTPLRRVVLRRAGKDAWLRLEFREDVQVTHSVKAGPGGAILVEIVVPKPTREYPSSTTQKPKGSGTEVDAEEKTTVPLDPAKP
jgi:hypothetical protein